MISQSQTLAKKYFPKIRRACWVVSLVMVNCRCIRISGEYRRELLSIEEVCNVRRCLLNVDLGKKNEIHHYS